MNLQYINTVAKNEARLLRRSWLFRIFAGIIIFILTLIQFLALTNLMENFYSSWDQTANSSFIPLFSSYYYTIGQAMIVIFLAGGVLKRNQKIDTAEVFMIRPMNNSDYIIGKVLGVLRVLLGLNLIPICIGIIITLVINHSTFSFLPYILYPLCLSMPAMLFVLGLSFLVINTIKNQAVTFVIMLGIVISLMMYLTTPMYGVFDFLGIHIPNTFSDIAEGFNVSTFLLQRAVYFLFAIGAICISIALMPRLANRKSDNIRYFAFAILFFGGSFFCGMEYVNIYKAKRTMRDQYTELYKTYSNAPHVQIKFHDITWQQEGEQISAQSRISIENGQQPIDSFVLFLNPGLEVANIQSQTKQNVSFKKEGQIVMIYASLGTRQTDSLEINYHGTLDENVCYADFPSDSLYIFNGEQFHNDIRFVYSSQAYTLLTPECIWYPTADAPVDAETRYGIRRSFTRYSLTVKNPQGTCISQGERTENDGNVRFACEMPLNGLSLVVGDYECHSMQLNDSLNVAVWNLRGHDFYVNDLAIIADTLKPVLVDIKNNIETDHNLTYPYRRFSLIETPLSFNTPLRNWRSYSERIQPELVFFTEWGINMNADFKHEVKNMQRWQRDQLSEQEMYINALHNFVNRQLNDLNNKITNISPLFNSFRTFVSADSCSLFDVVFTSMQKKEATQDLAVDQQANIYLHKHSLQEAINDFSLRYDVLYEIIQLKSDQIKNQILAHRAQNEWDAFIRYFYQKHSFQQVDIETVINDYNAYFHTDMRSQLTSWFTEIQSPEIEIIDVKSNVVVIGDASKYAVSFKVSNSSTTNAILTATIMSGDMGGGPWGRPSNNENLMKYFVIPAQSDYSVRISCDDRPNRMTINTGVSANLPNEYTFSFPNTKEETTDTLFGQFCIKHKAFLPPPNEIIVDNEDSCFIVEDSDQKRFLQTIFQSKAGKDTYKNLNTWNIPTQWTPIVTSNCYGKVIHSAMYKKAGSGQNRATWKVNIPENNNYEIFTWYVANEMRRGGGGPRGFRGNETKENIYTYLVQTPLGKESVDVKYNGRESEWISLGTFYLPEGEIRVSVLDKSSEDYVIADAIKIIPNNKRKQNNNNQIDNE